MTITPTQVKAARELLGWSPAQLAIRSSLPTGKLNMIESGQMAATPQNLDDIRNALENAGIEFAVQGPDLRLKEDKAITAEEVKVALRSPTLVED